MPARKGNLGQATQPPPTGGKSVLFKIHKNMQWSNEYCVCVSRSFVSDSLQHHGLQPARPLCPSVPCLEFSRQEYWSGLPCPSPTMEYDSAIKREHDFAICTTWMELEMIIRSEVSQMKKDKHCVIPLTCGI